MAFWCTFALAAVHLLSYLPVANGQVSSAVCSADYAWASNSLGQNPCKVASYLLSTCNGGQYNISALAPGFHYLPPTPITANACQCSSVCYSLVAACADCQGAPFSSWSTWTFNCTEIYAGQFPKDIPFGTVVPGWAYLDVQSTDGYNATIAHAAISNPESSAAPKPTGTINTSSTSLFSAGQPTATPFFTSFKKKSNVGAIAGGVVGGIAVLGLLALIGICLCLRHRRAAKAPSKAYLASDPLPPPAPSFAQHGMAGSYGSSSNGMYSGSPPPRLYDPSDPSTFPGSPASDMHTTAHTTYSSHHPLTGSSPGHYGGTPEI